MPEHVGRDLLDVLGQDEGASGQERVGPGGEREMHRRARRGPEANRGAGPAAGRLARRPDDVEEVAAQRRLQAHLLDGFARGGDLGPRHGRTRRREGPVQVTLENPHFLVAGRVVDVHLHEEAIELRLGQRVGALVLEGVLRRQHQERVGQRVRVSPMVTWRSCMASSSALCTLAGARLISSASTRLAKIGPLRTLNAVGAGRRPASRSRRRAAGRA